MAVPQGVTFFASEKRVSTGVWVGVAVITVLALGLRVGYVSVTKVVTPLRADALQYVTYAQNLVYHGTFSLEAAEGKPVPDSYRSPGYPAFLAALILLAGDDVYPVIKYTQAILGGCMAPMTFRLGVFFLPPWAALAASVFVAWSPHLVASTGYVLTETLFGFLLLAGLLGFFFALRKPTRGGSLFTGLCFGCAYLTNEIALVVVLGLCGAGVFMNGTDIRSSFNHIHARRILNILIVFLLFPTAWTLRNHTRVPPQAPNGKDRLLMTLTHGTYPDFLYNDPKFKYYPYREDPRQPEFSASFSGFVKIFSQRVRQRPWRYALWYGIEKPYYLWSWNILQGQGDVYVYPVEGSLYQRIKAANATRVFMKALHPVVLLLCLCSVPFLFVARRKIWMEPDRWNGAVLVLSTVLACTSVYTVLASWPRYSVPLRPQLYLCAFWSLAFLCSWRRPSENGRRCLSPEKGNTRASGET